MQFGHLGIALAIASLDPRPETFAVVGAAQFLPNLDSLVVRDVGETHHLGKAKRVCPFSRPIVYRT